MTTVDDPRSPSAQQHVEALFGEPPRRGRWRRRAALGAVVVLAVVGSAVVAARASGSEPGRYRTAAVSRRDVAALLDAVATIEPVSQAAVAFPVAGTVDSVRVEVGDSVTVGGTLATLDTASLEDTLHERQAALDQAELTLARALAGETVSTTGGATGSGSPTPGASATSATMCRAERARCSWRACPSGPGPATEAAADTDARLAEAQQAVLGAQREVDEALAAADRALADATAVCGAVGDRRAGGPGGLQGRHRVGAGRPARRERCPDGAGGCGLRPRCPAGRAGGHRSGAQHHRSLRCWVHRDLTVGSLPVLALGGFRRREPVAGSSTPSSADLVAYQKAVDAAAPEVAVAEQAVAQATIVSPIAGTVVSVGMAVGDEVTAGSSTAAIIIDGDGGYEVVATVGLADIGHVAVGQEASLVPDGSDLSLAGQVTAISSTPDDDASTTSFRVTVGLTDPGADLRNGATGTVTITTDGAVRVLAVPTSAVAVDGDRHTVTVLTGSGTEDIAVQVGVVGAEWTEITGGLEEGRRVVLADLDEALPGAATDTSDPAGASPTGGFPGGGPPAGFTPPGAG